ncbi:MAG: SUMF1/EgtB/PvdO family nonheme iron enzyme [Prevotella sp.]|nr:SUMF1/EgtB/PvdO family nonheme iron enzyme [Prevotella sp.]
MKTRHISYLFWILTLLFALPVSAQKMMVESMVHDPFDQTANLSENMYKDNNQEYGGLVKVRLAVSGATFEGWVLKQEPHGAGEYWVFMAKGSGGLTVKAPGYLPLEVDFSNYDDCIVKSLHTYILTITLPQAAVAGPVDDGMRYLAMTVDPKNSTVFVDGAQQTVDANGEVSVLLPKGTHRYQVSAPGYATKEGSVEVGDDNRPLSVKLVSTQATLRVECATKGAQVFINNQQRGTAPWSGLLASGSYQVEVRLDGYRSQKQTVTLAQSEKRTLTIPELQQITGRLNVDCRPLGSEVYVDGKKVGTTPNIFRDIQVGQRRVEIRKDGYETLTKTVTINENEQASVTGTLKAIVAATPSTPSSPSSPNSPSSAKETFTVNGVSFTMVRVDGGTFTMGATSEQRSDAGDDEKPAHQVTLSTYMIGETEVTQALWQAVMGNNPSKFKGDSSRPVEEVSWNDCQTFIKKLNSMTGKTFRLPTEAEWEYAAKGGNKSRHYKYSGSNNLDDVAWYWENSGDNRLSGEWDYNKIIDNHCKTHRVKTKSPNELGLYDMSGNVYEWCSDYWYSGYSSSAQTNPKGPASGTNRVNRGCSWDSSARCGRVSDRNFHTSGSALSNLGLRLAL